MTYNETAKEVYIDKQERIKPKYWNNHNTDKPDISLDIPKQEKQRKNEGEQEIWKTEIMKEVVENEMKGELVVGSYGKEKQIVKVNKIKKTEKWLKYNMEKKKDCERNMKILVRS